MARDRSEGGGIPSQGLGSLLDATEPEARRRRCEAIIAGSGEAIWSGSIDGTIESWNPAAERLDGYREEEIVGRSAALLRPADDVDDFTREQSAVAGTPGLSHLAPAMRAEHERWDGGGYPDGLAGDEIPLASRITLACDALDAMTNDRPYRPAMTIQRAQEELRSGAGTQFDPRTVEALLAQLRPAELSTTTAPIPDSLSAEALFAGIAGEPDRRPRAR